MRESFFDAVEEGQRAALDAERNRKEIREVVEELAAQIAEGSSHKLRIERDFGNMILVDPDSGRVHQALLLVSGEVRHQLCKFQEGPRGYPVEISYPGGFAAPTDRASLVVALKDVLSTPAVGSIFNHVLGPPSDTEPESASG